MRGIVERQILSKQTLRHYKYHTDILAESCRVVKTIANNIPAIKKIF